MLVRIARLLIVLTLILAAACGPAASTATPSPTGAPATAQPATALPSPSAVATPTSGPSETPIPLPSGATIAAASGGVVWMYVNGDHLFFSLNRGDTWTRRTLPPDPRSAYLAFISAGEGWWLAPGSPGTQCSFQSAAIWKTDDGAVTWRKLDATGIDEQRCKGGIAFSGPGVGYITAWDESSAPVVYRTADGGRTWAASRPLPDPPGFTTTGAGTTLRVGNIADFGSVLFADAYAFVGGQAKHWIFRSVDRGATWTFASTPPASPTGITFLTPSRWIAILLPQPSAETTDGGSTWHSFASDYQQAAPIAPQIAFGDANTGYATVRGGLQRTLDGGAHWASLRTPGT